jgi:BirA family biotin operon repressor/biotin-[acetyl-CoA-carboxylase] ligase
LPVALELLEPDAILDGLPRELRPIVNDLQVLWVTESTSDYLLRYRRTAPDQARICLAEYQTGGRGRRGRQWFAGIGSGLCISLGWCFPSAPESLSCLGLAMGVGVLRAVQVCGVSNAKLKWPNDVVVGDQKLAGILVDIQGEAGGPLQVVVGVGLNYAPDLHATSTIVAAGGLAPVSLSELGTVIVGRNKVAAELIAALIRVLQQFQRSGFETLVDEWRSADCLYGKVIQVVAGDRETVGVAGGISREGQLLVNINGTINQLVTGDVSVRAVI